MTPRLVLLTGPAAGEVAEVLREMVNGDALRYVTGNGPASTWDEVRDYWEAPDRISGGGGPTPVEPECGACNEIHPCRCCKDAEKIIRSLPGGEKWLVGLVLPTPRPYDNLTCGHTHWRCSLQWGCKVCRGYYRLPARLAILAPDPPPLLVERVRAWGGQAWFCASDVGEQACSIALGANEEEACESACAHGQTLPCEWEADTWPEAVRAALGEGL